MGSGNTKLGFAIRAVNEANKALKEVTDDLGQVEKSAKDADGALSKMGHAMGDMAKIAGGFVLAQGFMKAPDMFMGMSNTARDLELQMKKANIVFGDQIGVVKSWAAANASAMGLTKSQAVNLAAGLADLLVPMGMTREAAAEMSTKTIGLAGALAEWSGGAKSAAEVSDILTKAYLGETDGLKALGISISAADVQARLAAKGQQNLTGAAREQAEALAIQEMVFEKSTDAQKAFAEGAGSAARKQAEMKARIQEAREALAMALAPAFAAVTTKMAEFVPLVIDLGTALGTRIAPVIRDVGQTIRADVMPPLQDFAGIIRDEVVPAIGGEVLPRIEAFGAVLKDDIVPAVQAFAAAVADKLEGPLKNIVDKLGGSKEIFQNAGIVIGTVLVVAFTAWAVSAGMAAAATLLAMAPVIAIVAAVALLGIGIVALVRHWDDLTAKYPAVGAAADAVKEKFLAFVNWIRSDFVPGVMKVYEATKEAIEKAVEFVKTHWETIGPIVKAPLEVAQAHVQLFVDNFKTIFESVATIIQGVVNIIAGVFTGDWGRAWDGVKQVFEGVWNGITGMIGNFATFIMGVVPAVLAAGRALGSAVFDGIKAAISGVAGIAEDIATAIGSAIKSFINSQIIDRINSALEFTIKVPLGPDIYIDPPDIPHLARGGIVTRPTLALIGEAGPEAVIPLSRGRGAVGATEVHFHINAIDARSFEEFLNRDGGRAIDRHLRRAGLAGLA